MTKSEKYLLILTGSDKLLHIVKDSDILWQIVMESVTVSDRSLQSGTCFRKWQIVTDSDGLVLVLSKCLKLASFGCLSILYSEQIVL